MTQDTYNFRDWFVQNWSRTTLPIIAILLLLSPFLAPTLGTLVFLVFLQLPIYMLHQYEEHAHGRFRLFINDMLAGGQPIITLNDIFWINILGVWCVNIMSVYLAHYVSPSLGLVSPYLSLVNAVLHIGPAIMQRRYNPGLWTSLFLFIPVGSYTIVMFTTLGGASILTHIFALGAAVVLHVVTFAYMRRNLSPRTSEGH